uniref:Ribosome biogenesis protein bop1 n=1 Tax=Ascaris lumbricoides TaxID=6252 RepID=A0A0M3HMG0_ASCLU
SNIWSLDQSSSFTYSSPSVIRQRRLLVFGHDLGRAPIFHGPTDVVCHIFDRTKHCFLFKYRTREQL